MAEADGTGSQLKGIFLELGVILGSGVAPYSRMWPVVVIMVLAWVGMAWTRRRVGELDGPEQVDCSCGGLSRV